MKQCSLKALAYKHKTSGSWLCFEYRNDVHVVSLMKEFDPLCCIVRDEDVLNNSFYDWHYRKMTKLQLDELIPIEVTISYTDNSPINVEVDFN